MRAADRGQQLLRKHKEAMASYPWIAQHADALASPSGWATRRQAAEFFSVLQSERFLPIWQEFSRGFVAGALKLKSWTFHGLLNAAPTSAHVLLAKQLRKNNAFAISLNFDGLSHRALLDGDSTGATAIALHSSSDIETYFTARTTVNVPSIAKIRGDTFYARCGTASCPHSIAPYPIDRLHPIKKGQSLRCPNCNSGDLRLQFQFPGYRAKEETAHPMLSSIRRFIGNRLSVIFLVGFSGRWDSYLLSYLFDLIQDYSLWLVDVKPPGGRDSLLIDEFRHRYYDTVPHVAVDTPKSDSAAYMRLELGATEFFNRLDTIF